MIAVVDSGSGNLRSVERALAHVGGAPVLTADPDLVRRADKVVVPGQGAFADCMAAMRRSGLGEAVREVIRAGVPYLGICLGLQVLFEDSEEHGPVAGLGVLGGHVVRFPHGRLKVPHIGWNQVRAHGEEALLAGIPPEAHFYFIHSFVAVPDDPTCVALTCDYGGAFCAAVRKDNLFACQFHPEKSQAVGLRLLANFASAP
ncbi:MAG TPA: imidazole glycerol phosphate synthase subunit HisH [Kofleriaceae bacterium]|nr:imidazole glycerol phosphate synthase subunit HisH [Kofleriaceae bacterium]